MATVRVQREDFDVGDEARALISGRRDVGALVSFVGLCRDEGGRLAALEIEHYPGMAEAEIARVVAEVEARWPLIGVAVVHRYGTIRPGERIVYVGVVAASRRDAYAAAETLMDCLKTRALFWKRERLSDGSTGDWVEGEAGEDGRPERRRAAAAKPSSRGA